MRVVLVAPPVMDRIGDRLRPISMDRHRECPPYGLYLLASILKSAGHDVVLADLVALGSRSLRRYRDDIADSELVGIGATTFSWPTARDVIKQVRQIREDVPIVLGGVHPTMFDKYILQRQPVQYVVRGEGELALLALCEALEKHSPLTAVPNLSWRDADGQIVRNPIGTRIPAERLASFPLPDYSALPLATYAGVAIESSRGCAFDCSFCSTMYRRCWRGMPAAPFVDRLESVMQHLGRTRHRSVAIVDDEFSTKPQRAVEILDIVRRRGLHPRLTFDCRASDLLWDGYAESVAEFAAAFLVGAECGYDEGLARVGKGTTCEVLEKAAGRLMKQGISNRASFSFILGLPWETMSQVRQTIHFATHLLCTYGVRIILQWYLLVPGSRLWDDARRRQVANEAMYDDYGVFRNLYLFRNGRHLSPGEMWELSSTVQQLRGLARLGFQDENMISSEAPTALRAFFPERVLSEKDAGLANLRELACPGADRDDPC